MLKKIFLMTMLMIAASSAYVHACMQGQVSIVGSSEDASSGAGVNDNGICEVTFIITKIVKQHPACPLRVKVGQEITARTELSEEKCPTDEFTVRGVLSSGGSGAYNFKGTVK